MSQLRDTVEPDGVKSVTWVRLVLSMSDSAMVLLLLRVSLDLFKDFRDVGAGSSKLSNEARESDDVIVMDEKSDDRCCKLSSPVMAEFLLVLFGLGVEAVWSLLYSPCKTFSGNFIYLMMMTRIIYTISF